MVRIDKDWNGQGTGWGPGTPYSVLYRGYSRKGYVFFRLKVPYCYLFSPDLISRFSENSENKDPRKFILNRIAKAEDQTSRSVIVFLMF